MLASFNYKERGTFIQRLDPRSRLIFALCATIATVLLWDLRLLAVPFGIALAQLWLARLTWRETRRFWMAVSFLFTFMTLLTLLTGRGGTGLYTSEHAVWQASLFGLPIVISVERLVFAVAQLVRLFTMATLAMVLPFTIHPAAYGIAFRRMGLPDNIAFALDLAIRFIPSLGNDFMTTLDAQRARGYELERAGGVLQAIRNTAPLLIPITIGSILKGEDVVDAMNLHAFGVGPRTWVQELHYRPADYAVIALGLLLMAAAMVLAARGLNGLWVPSWLLFA